MLERQIIHRSQFFIIKVPDTWELLVLLQLNGLSHRVGELELGVQLDEGDVEGSRERVVVLRVPGLPVFNLQLDPFRVMVDLNRFGLKSKRSRLKLVAGLCQQPW